LVLLAMAFTLLIPAAAGAQTAAGRKRPPKKGGAGAGGVVPGGRKRPPKKPGPGPEAPVPGGEGEEGAEEEKPPVRTVKLSTRQDKVTLTDGKVLEGSLVAAGTKAVVIVTAEGEVTVPRAKVARIERGQATIETLLPRTYETMVVDGHEHIVVPLGLEDDVGAGPPGIAAGLGTKTAGAKTVELKYKLKKGDVIRAVLGIAKKDVETLPGRDRTLREETRRLVLTQTVGDVAADGMWTTAARYELLSLMRGYANVTALESKIFAAARVSRSLSSAGRWQPGADNVTGAGKDAKRFSEYLSYLTLPLPAKPTGFGVSKKLDEVVPAAITARMLRPPAQVTVPNWQVTGTYAVQGVFGVAGTNCARIVIVLKGTGSGQGAYAGARAALDVKADSVWDVYFGVNEGRVIQGRVDTTVKTTGKIGNDPLTCDTTLLATFDASGAVQTTEKGPAPEKGLDPEEPLKDDKLNKALDDLLNRLKDPNFLKEK